MSCLRDFVEEELSFGSSYGEGGALTPWIPQSHNVKSWNHSENNESHLKIDPVEYDLTDKKPFFGKTRWAMHKLAQMHTGTVETFPVGHWEYVSAHYSLPFQISTLLGFIMWGSPCRGQVSHTNRRHLHPEATISRTPPPPPTLQKQGRSRQERNGSSSFVPRSHFCPFVQFSLHSRNGGNKDAPVSVGTGFIENEMFHVFHIPSNIFQHHFRTIKKFPGISHQIQQRSKKWGH